MNTDPKNEILVLRSIDACEQITRILKSQNRYNPTISDIRLCLNEARMIASALQFLERRLAGVPDPNPEQVKEEK